MDHTPDPGLVSRYCGQAMVLLACLRDTRWNATTRRANCRAAIYVHAQTCIRCRRIT